MGCARIKARYRMEKTMMKISSSPPLIRMRSGSKPNKPERPVIFENRWMIRPCWIQFNGR